MKKSVRSEGRSIKIVNFMNPRTGILVLGRGHTCHTGAWP